MTAIKTALQELGYKAGTEFTLSTIRQSRVIVYVENEPFGIWDFEKRTFVD